MSIRVMIGCSAPECSAEAEWKMDDFSADGENLSSQRAHGWIESSWSYLPEEWVWRERATPLTQHDFYCPEHAHLNPAEGP